MISKLAVYVTGTLVAIPILLWFAIRGMFKGGWRLFGFLCQRQYQTLRNLCEHGTADELQAFLSAHPGAREYVIYTRQGRTTAFVTSFFHLPSPLAVAGKANNLAVIPVLLDNGASPEVRSVSENRTPAEEAIGDPDKMRALCGGKTWWLERPGTADPQLEASIKAANFRGIIWHVLRGARLTDYRQLCTWNFLHSPLIVKEFICRFAVNGKQRKEYLSLLKRLSPTERKQICHHRFHTPMGTQGVSLGNEFEDMMGVLDDSRHPLPHVDSDAVDSLLLSAGLMGRKQMLELLDNLFTTEQQFSLLSHFLHARFKTDDREQTEETVDLLLCSLLAKAGA